MIDSQDGQQKVGGAKISGETRPLVHNIGIISHKYADLMLAAPLLHTA